MTGNRKPPLWGHQKQTKALGRKQPRVLDTSDAGTGKTRAHLEVFAERRRKGGGKALVVAPKSLLESAWGEDIMKWTPDMQFIAAYAENREFAFSQHVDIYITNTDAVKWLVKKPKSFFKQFDTIIIDEISYFKHPTSQRSKALRKIAPHFDYRVGMSATLTPISVTEAWHPMFILDDGKRLGTSFYKFRNEVCIAEQVGPMPNHIKWNDKPNANALVSILIKDMSVNHDFEQCMDIPPNHTKTVKYELPSKLYKQYLQMEADALLQLENDQVSAVNKAVLQNKLLQIASGAIYHSDHKYSVLDTGRYGMTLDLVERYGHSIVFFSWVHQRDELAKMATKRKLDFAVIDGTVHHKKRSQIVQDYQKGNYQAVFMHPKTGAHGLTLTKGVATIWPSPIHEADLAKQGLHRVRRGGQTKKTYNVMMQARDTIEAGIYARQQIKGQRMADLMTLIRELRD